MHVEEEVGHIHHRQVEHGLHDWSQHHELVGVSDYGQYLLLLELVEGLDG